MNVCKEQRVSVGGREGGRKEGRKAREKGMLRKERKDLESEGNNKGKNGRQGGGYETC